MNLLEYQAKKIFEEAGIRVPPALAIHKSADIRKIREGIFPKKWKEKGYVIKAQVTAGGRGKAGGVKLVKTAKDAQAAAKAMLGSELKTAQTAGAGIKIESVLVADMVPIQKEFYMAIAVNRKKACPVMIVSRFGGMEIEEAAHKDPNALAEIEIDPWEGAPKHRLRRVAEENLQIPAAFIDDFIDLASKAAWLYIKRDLALLEINPMALTPEGFYAVDAKVSLEENALFRQPENQTLAKYMEKFLEPSEKKAKKIGVSFIPIGGTIGCLVNGAGLAMATMDLISLHGGTPANFLDVGGGAVVDQVRGAFELLFANKDSKAIFVNIFGGIMRCDIIAQALLEAHKNVPLKKPLVARLLGTNVDKAKEMLAQAKLPNVEVYSDLDTAVRRVCKVAANVNLNGSKN